MLYLQQTNPRTGARITQRIRTPLEGIQKSKFPKTSTIHKIPHNLATNSEDLLQACRERPSKCIRDILRQIVKGISEKKA